MKKYMAFKALLSGTLLLVSLSSYASSSSEDLNKYLQTTAKTTLEKKGFTVNLIPEVSWINNPLEHLAAEIGGKLGTWLGTTSTFPVYRDTYDVDFRAKHEQYSGDKFIDFSCDLELFFSPGNIAYKIAPSKNIKIVSCSDINGTEFDLEDIELPVIADVTYNDICMEVNKLSYDDALLCVRNLNFSKEHYEQRALQVCMMIIQETKDTQGTLSCLEDIRNKKYQNTPMLKCLDVAKKDVPATLECMRDAVRYGYAY